jgi:hypothetical protein
MARTSSGEVTSNRDWTGNICRDIAKTMTRSRDKAGTRSRDIARTRTKTKTRSRDKARTNSRDKARSRSRVKTSIGTNISTLSNIVTNPLHPHQQRRPSKRKDETRQEWWRLTFCQISSRRRRNSPPSMGATHNSTAMHH